MGAGSRGLARAVWLAGRLLGSRAATAAFILRRVGFDLPRAQSARRRVRGLHQSAFDAAYYNLMRTPQSVVSPYWHYVLEGERQAARIAPVPGRSTPARTPAQAAAILGGHGERDAPEGPLFSVIMPTRDRAAILPRAIDSVLAQSMADFELLVIDDASRDSTAALVRRRYASQIKAGRIRLLAGPGQGPARARNLGLAAANGRFIAYLDCDNTWGAEHLAVHAQALLAGATSAASRPCGAGGGDMDAYRRALHLQRPIMDMNGFSHRRRLYDLLGGFDTRLTRLEDWDFMLRMTRVSAPRILGAETFVYALQPDSISVRRPLTPNRAAVWRNHAFERALLGIEDAAVHIMPGAARSRAGEAIAALAEEFCGRSSSDRRVTVATESDLAGADGRRLGAVMFLGDKPPQGVAEHIASVTGSTGASEWPALLATELQQWSREMLAGHENRLQAARSL